MQFRRQSEVYYHNGKSYRGKSALTRAVSATRVCFTDGENVSGSL